MDKLTVYLSMAEIIRGNLGVAAVELKKPIINIDLASEEDQDLLGHLFIVCKNLAKELKIDRSGYQILTNVGEGGGQTVMHLHLHLLLLIIMSLLKQSQRS